MVVGRVSRKIVKIYKSYIERPTCHLSPISPLYQQRSCMFYIHILSELELFVSSLYMFHAIMFNINFFNLHLWWYSTFHQLHSFIHLRHILRLQVYVWLLNKSDKGSYTCFERKLLLEKPQKIKDIELDVNYKILFN